MNNNIAVQIVMVFWGGGGGAGGVEWCWAANEAED